MEEDMMVEVLLDSYVARVVLGYLYEQKLDDVASIFCQNSEFLLEERAVVRRGFKPTMFLQPRLHDVFQQYVQVQMKLKNFIDCYGSELSIPADNPSVMQMLECLLTALKCRLQSNGAASKRRRSVAHCQISRHSSQKSDTSLQEPKKKRVCLDPSFTIMSVPNSVAQETASVSGSESPNIGSEPAIDPDTNLESKSTDEHKRPTTDLISQTILANETYTEKLANLITNELETSNKQLSQQPNSSLGELEKETSQVGMNSCDDPFGFNFDDVITNIMNATERDGLLSSIVEDIARNNDEDSVGLDVDLESEPLPLETPLKERLRKTTKKDYTFNSVLKKSTKKVTVLSDVPYEGEPITQIFPAAQKTTIICSENSTQEIQNYTAMPVFSVADVAVADNESVGVVLANDAMLPPLPTLIPMPSLIPDSYYISGYYLDSDIVYNGHSDASGLQHITLVPFSNENHPTETIEIGPVASQEVIIDDSSVAVPTTIVATSLPLDGTQVVVSTPPNVKNLLQSAARSASTPSRKGTHVRILNFQTPSGKQQEASIVSSACTVHTTTPSSAPPSVDLRSLANRPLLGRIDETSFQAKSPEIRLEGDWEVVNGLCITSTTNAVAAPATIASAVPAPLPLPLVNAEHPKPELSTTNTTAIHSKPIPTTTTAASNDTALAEWQRIRSISKSNFDQHLREMEVQRMKSMPKMRVFRRKANVRRNVLPRSTDALPRRNTTAKKKSKKKKRRSSSQDGDGDSPETSTNVVDTSLQMDAQKLEDALKSAKKDKQPKKKSGNSKTPGKGKNASSCAKKKPTSPVPRDESKIYVKISTPKKRSQKAKEQGASMGHNGSKQKDAAAAEKKRPSVDIRPTPSATPAMASAELPAKASKDPLGPLLIANSSSELAELAKLSPPAPTSGTIDDINSSDVSQLITPWKPEADSVPFTPRFMVVAGNSGGLIQETPAAKMIRETTEQQSRAADAIGCGGGSIEKGVDIMTPDFPITPGMNSTPLSILRSLESWSGGGGGEGGYSTRRTDPSSGSSYYKPDESEDLDRHLNALFFAQRKQQAEQPPAPAPVPVAARPPVQEPVPVVTQPTVVPDAELPQTDSIFEARRRQKAELEAKKMRTIARLKSCKTMIPEKRIAERRITTTHGSMTNFKPRKTTTASRANMPMKKTTSVAIKPAPAPSSSSKRKNPTPRKLIRLDSIPLPTKQSRLPRRRSPRTAKAPASAPVEDDTPKVSTVPKTGTESNNESECDFPKLCVSPDYESSVLVMKNNVPVQQEPTAVANECKLPKDTPETPESNKENRKISSVCHSPIEDGEIVNDEDDDEDDDDDSEDLQLRSYTEDTSNACYYHMVYDDRCPKTARPTIHVDEKCESLDSQKLNIVLNNRQYLIEIPGQFDLFEQAPQKPSPRRVSKTKVQRTAEPPLPTPQPTTMGHTIRPKVNVLFGTPAKSRNRNTKRLSPFWPSQQSSASTESAAPNVMITSHDRATEVSPVTITQLSDVIIPAPKLPLKLDMKAKQRVAMKGMLPSGTGEQLIVESKHIELDDIDAVLTHIHGS